MPATDPSPLAAPTTFVPRGSQISAVVRVWLIETINALTQEEPFRPLRGKVNFDVGFHLIPNDTTTTPWVPIIGTLIEIPVPTQPGQFLYASPAWQASGLTREAIEHSVRECLETLAGAASNPPPPLS